MHAEKLSPRVPGTTDEHVDDSLKEASAPDYHKYQTISKRLEVNFGTGDNPALRRKLYIRLQACAVEHGPDCYEAIRSCVAAAAVADYPGKYFCAAVTRELKSLGFWEPSTDF